MTRITDIKFDNLDYNLGLKRESKQNFPTDKSIKEKEKRRSSIDKTISTKLTIAEKNKVAAEKNKVTILIKNDLRRSMIMKYSS